MTDEQLQQRLLNCAECCWQQASAHYPALPQPRIWFDLRGRSAGQAHYQRGGLRFNMTLYRDQPETFLAEVVPHEMAHWVVHHSVPHRVRPHGHEWQSVMRELFRLPPRVTHTFDTSRATPVPYGYRCHCARLHRFTARRHALARRGRRYRCRYCQGVLHYQGRIDPHS
ncbi:SprT-like domain-containing protein [Kushneria phosphatilytica]|uniref:Metallopeptidase n=1 Tax=Kushneria phosphatilytica TaxID=657387 RepID=A0A1S1NZ33_9GAMM|nr:SprT-like domain-containing protein [Kushneria phosphatilytica]OHV13456.1 metallopeptidase [Kushneria phosphatilytica]QEL10542.1 metallopeptidase [Kushneria phosphatilytica]